MNIIIGQIKTSPKLNKFNKIFNWIMLFFSVVLTGFSINWFINKKIDLFTFLFFILEMILFLFYTLFAQRHYLLIKNNKVTNRYLWVSNIINIIFIIGLVSVIFINKYLSIHNTVLTVNLAFILLIFNSLLGNIEYR